MLKGLKGVAVILALLALGAHLLVRLVWHISARVLPGGCAQILDNRPRGSAVCTSSGSWWSYHPASTAMAVGEHCFALALVALMVLIGLGIMALIGEANWRFRERRQRFAVNHR